MFLVMTSDTQLVQWASKNVSAAGDNDFLGVFMSDELDKAREAIRGSRARVRSMIFNYDPRGKPGTHWVACRFTPERGEWFDSYGTPPDWDDKILHDRTHFRAFLRDLSPRGKYKVNSIDLQALETDVCGQYALWFCKHGLPSQENEAWRKLLAIPDRKKRDEAIRSLVHVLH